MRSRNVKWRSVDLKIKEFSEKCLVFLVATCTGNDKGPITGKQGLDGLCTVHRGGEMRINLSLVRTFSCLGARELNPFLYSTRGLAITNTIYQIGTIYKGLSNVLTYR